MSSLKPTTLSSSVHVSVIKFNLFLMLALGALSLASPVPATTFTNVTQQMGIDVNTTAVPQDFGAGAVFLDYDLDGDLDLYVVMDDGVPNKLYKYEQGVYVDVAAAAGVADTNWGHGCKCADYDNDGDQDLFLGNFNAPNRLFRNNADGTFSDVTTAAGVTHTGPTYGASWGDYDRDGHLDLYVITYYGANLLYRNLGNGTFSNRAAVLGVQDAVHPGFDSAWFDYDNDNDLDLYIINDLYTGNVLYRNDGGIFVDVSASSGTGLPMAAMGIAIADYDHNGYMDLYITNTTAGNALLHNNGDGTFDDLARTLRVHVGQIGWGTAFFDYDNDGNDDLYIVNYKFENFPVLRENVLFRNNGGTFTDVTAAAGVGDRGPGFGLAMGDYNDDGFTDFFVHNTNAPSVLFRNSPNGNNWIKFRTIGTMSNRDGVGARIRVVAGSLAQMNDRRAGSSYLSQHMPYVSFGLAGATTIDLVEVTWPSGIVDTYNDVAPNQTMTVTEGETTQTPVLIASFVAEPIASGIELHWSVTSDDEIIGYRVYRRKAGESSDRLLTSTPLDRHASGYTDQDVQSGGQYDYALGVVESDGAEFRSAVVRVQARPSTLSLTQNHPNPFNPNTVIRFSLPARQHVEVIVFDTRGKRIRTLADAVREAGPHSVTWDGTDSNGKPVSTGVYFYRLNTENALLTRKMVLLK